MKATTNYLISIFCFISTFAAAQSITQFVTGSIFISGSSELIADTGDNYAGNDTTTDIYKTTAKSSEPTIKEDNNSRWRFGINLGFNSLKLRDGINQFELFASGRSRTQRLIQYKHLSFQGEFFASLDLNRHFGFIGGLGITKARSGETRKINDSFITTQITEDVVIQKYLFLYLPISLRWKMIPEDNEKWNFKPFFDLGFSINVPLVNNSSFSSESSSSGFLFFPSTNSQSSGELQMQPASVFCAFGLSVGKRASISVRWAGVSSKSTSQSNQKVSYNSTLTSLIFSRSF